MNLLYKEILVIVLMIFLIKYLLNAKVLYAAFQVLIVYLLKQLSIERIIDLTSVSWMDRDRYQKSKKLYKINIFTQMFLRSVNAFKMLWQWTLNAYEWKMFSII